MRCVPSLLSLPSWPLLRCLRRRQFGDIFSLPPLGACGGVSQAALSTPAASLPQVAKASSRPSPSTRSVPLYFGETLASSLAPPSCRIVASPSPSGGRRPTARGLPPACTQRILTRRALAARFAAGPLVDSFPPVASLEDTPSSADPLDFASPIPPRAGELRAAAKRAMLALQQTQRLVHAGLREDHVGGGTAPAAGEAAEEVEHARRERDVTWQAFFTSRSNAADALDASASPLDSCLEDFEADAAAAEDAVSGPRRASFGVALSDAELMALLQWCGGEVQKLATAIAAAVDARERRSDQDAQAAEANHKDDVCARDGTAMRAPGELREAHRRLYGCIARDAPTAAAGDNAADTLAGTRAPFRDPMNAVDILEGSALLLALLEAFLRVLVEDVLVMDVTADSVNDEGRLGRIAHDVIADVISVLRTSVVPKALAGVAETARMLASNDGAARNTLFYSPATHSTEEGEESEEEQVPFTAALLEYGLRHLAFSEEVVLLAICSQRADGERALELTGRLYLHNASLPNAKAAAAEAATTVTVALAAERGSYDVRMTLAYVLAQRGAWTLCRPLLERTNDGGAAAEPHAAPPTALAKLLLSIALANAPRHVLPHRVDAQGQGGALLASLAQDVEDGVCGGRRPPSRGTSGGRSRTRGVLSHQDLLFHVVSLGIFPTRPLSLAEYGALLKQLFRHHHVSTATAAPRTTSTTTARGTAASGRHRDSSSDRADVSWVLSPSQVWRHTSGFPHHIRTTLCLLGFQVLAKHGLVDSMTLEDLLVVLSLTRQLRRQRSRALQRRYRLRQRARVAASGVAPTPLLRNVHEDDGGEATARLAEEEEARVTQESDEEAAEETTSALSGAFPSFLLPAACRPPPASLEHLQRLCAAYGTVSQHHRGDAPDDDLLPTGGRAAARARSAAVSGGASGRRSAVMLSVVSHELLALLKAAHFGRVAAVCWEAVLTAVGAIMPHEGLSPDTVQLLEDLVKGLVRAISEAASAPLNGPDINETPRRTPSVDGCAAEGRSKQNRGVGRCSEDTIATLRDPLIRLAPYVSPFTVAFVVQSPAGRFLSARDCRRLIPYAPLGSRSQTQLLRRVAQLGHGSRNGDAFLPRTRAPPREEGARVDERTVPPVASPQTKEPRPFSEPLSPAGTHSLVAAAAASATTTMAAARAKAGAIVADEQQMLSLLMERDWTRAWQRFQQAPARVRAAGAPHVVRLVIEADAWHDLDDVQLRPLVRLAVRSCLGHGAGGVGGGDATTATTTINTTDETAADFTEEVLRTTLAHGMWTTGLRFHQLVVEEQPALIARNARAQRYAAMLCRGLMEKTSLTRAMAQVFKATRRGQWEVASAHFILYATGGSVPVETDTAPRADAAAPAYPKLSMRMARHVLDTAVARRRETADAQQQQPSQPSRGFDGKAVRAITGGWPFAVQVPAELLEFAQATRYALLHTPQTRDDAFTWFPAAALPVPAALLDELYDTCGPAFLLSRGVALPAARCGREEHSPVSSLGEDGVGSSSSSSSSGGGGEDGDASTASSALATASTPRTRALSLIEAARHRADSVVHRPNWTVVNTNHEVFRDALQLLHERGHWMAALAVYTRALEVGCLPYQASALVLRTTLSGGAPWQVTLRCFAHMSRRMRPDVLSTAAALEACAAGGQWAMAFRVLKQSILTQSTPAPQAVALAINTALQCGVWSRALQAAHMYRATRSAQLAHTVLSTYVATKHWNAAVEYFYGCTVRGIRPLDASLELALVACEAASEEYKRTAMMVCAIASALEDLYTVSGAVMEHIVFVHRHCQWYERPAGPEDGASGSFPSDADTDGRGAWANAEAPRAFGEAGELFARADAVHCAEAAALHADLASATGGHMEDDAHRRHRGSRPLAQRSDRRTPSQESAAWNPSLLLDPAYWEVFTADTPSTPAHYDATRAGALRGGEAPYIMQTSAQGR